MKTLVVLLLVTCPYDLTNWVTSDPPATRPPKYTEWLDSLKQVGNALDLTDSKTRWLYNFRSELFWTRNKYMQCRGTPPSSDFIKMPRKEEADTVLLLIHRTISWLERVKETNLHHQELAGVIQSELNRYEEWWSTAASLYYTDDFPADKRIKMGVLRKIIGKESYDAGDWPYPKVSP